MNSEIKLFIDDIKPAIYISEKTFKENFNILGKYNYKKCEDTGYLVSKTDIINTKSIGEILGYPPFCVKTFEEDRKKEIEVEFTSNFLNYGGIQFNCFSYYEEALKWCDEKYKEKLLNKYGFFKIQYYSLKFKRNYVKGYDREKIHSEIKIVTKNDE